MKGICIVLFSLVMVTATAQPTSTEDTLESQTSIRLGKSGSLSSTRVKANEVLKGGVSYSGIAVQVFKTDNLLQLFNPFAPAKYGSAEDNVLRDSVTGRAVGWKLFSIRF